MNKPLTLTALLASFTIAACGGMQDGSDEFREAVPSRSLLAMDVPAPAQNSEAGKKSSALLGAQAELYQLTYDVSRDVNKTIWVGLHTVDGIVKHPPTKVTANSAVWGPLGDALEPLTWMLVVERKSWNTYDYVLSARKRGDVKGSFTAILAGRSTRYPSGYKGVYTANADALRQLDPQNHDGTGKLVATYDTTKGQRSVKLALEGYTNKLGQQSNALYRYLARADRSGEFRFATYHDSVSGSAQAGTTAQELVTVASNWTAIGAGRGDATISGGDLKQGDYLLITECWDASFGRVFYEDSKSVEPQEGDVTQCAFTKALP
jgi:hypothetical protein